MKVRAASAATRSGAPPSPGGVAVEVVGVVHLYRQRDSDIVALRGVDLDVDAGELVALVGPSGMGKSTLMRLMAGVIRASAGLIRVGDHDMTRLSASERRALRAVEISYVVQGSRANLLPYATVVQNLWFAQHGARSRGRVPPWAPLELLDVLGLAELAEVRVAELARGQQQQVALAAGVGPAPRLLLADEPTSQLSEAASEDVVRLLQRINAELGTTIVLVTHDPTVARLFPRTVTIRDGRVGAEGRHGEEYAVVDGSGSVQLPPDVLEMLPPGSRLQVVRGPSGVELRRIDPPA